MKIKNTINIFCRLILLYCCTSCNFDQFSKQKKIDKYGLEVINYFYETAFYEDMGPGIKNHTYKWKNDILISLHGNLLKNDSLFVKDALSKLNALDIPISITLVADSKISNVKIFFGNLKSLEKPLNTKLDPNTVGVGHLIQKNKSNEFAVIGILNDAKIYTKTDCNSSYLVRKNIILEEITQALGIIGDSYTYYDSRFFEGGNDTDGLSNIDKKTVEFLYDKDIFRHSKISRNDFEEMFSDELYSRLNANKFSNLGYEYGLDSLDLINLKKILFTPQNKGFFVKFPRKIFLKILGNSTKKQFEFCKILATKLNKITPYIELELVKNESLWCNKYPSISIHYKEGREYRETISSQIEYITSKMMFTYKISGDIWIKYYDPNKESVSNSKIQSLHEEKVSQALFEILGLRFQKELIMCKTTNNFEINDKYKKYFRFIYDPRFPSDITELDYENLLKKIK